MKLTFGSWNVKWKKNAADFKLQMEALEREKCELIALQEVHPSYHAMLEASGYFSWATFSLTLRPPQIGEGKSRQYGCLIATTRKDLTLEQHYLIDAPDCPERALAVLVGINGHNQTLTVGSLHAPNGSQWGNRKAAWFHDVTEWLVGQTGPTIIGIDANTPKEQKLKDESPAKWWAEDKLAGVNKAAALVGSHPRHTLRDAWRLSHDSFAEAPYSHNRDARKRPEYRCRYDFILTSPEIKVVEGSAKYVYDDEVRLKYASSDHALVVAELEI